MNIIPPWDLDSILWKNISYEIAFFCCQGASRRVCGLFSAGNTTAVNSKPWWFKLNWPQKSSIIRVKAVWVETVVTSLNLEVLYIPLCYQFWSALDPKKFFVEYKKTLFNNLEDFGYLLSCDIAHCASVEATQKNYFCLAKNSVISDN